MWFILFQNQNASQMQWLDYRSIEDVKMWCLQLTQSTVQCGFNLFIVIYDQIIGLQLFTIQCGLNLYIIVPTKCNV